jgi:hypothetical protein
MQTFVKSKEPAFCPCCGVKLNGRWENLSKGLVKSLIKFRQGVLDKNENSIHLQTDLLLSKNEYNNFQKLRYHGLIAHYRNPVTKEPVSGYWLLTRRGNQFAKGDIHIPKKVMIFRNKIFERSDEYVSIEEVMKDPNFNYWPSKFDTHFEFLDIHDVDDITFDLNGQGKLF